MSALITCLAAIPCWVRNLSDADAYMALVLANTQGEPWFVLADVCRVLEVGNPSDAARRLDEDEKATLDNIEGRPGHGAQSFAIISESGLYSLILTSRKLAAKRFKKWVTAEVLPSIRKTGTYSRTPVATLPAPTQDRVSSLLLIGDAVAKVPGVKAGIAMAATLTVVMNPKRRAAADVVRIFTSPSMLTAWMPSAESVNHAVLPSAITSQPPMRRLVGVATSVSNHPREIGAAGLVRSNTRRPSCWWATQARFPCTVTWRAMVAEVPKPSLSLSR